MTPLFFDIETHSAVDRFRMSPAQFFRVGGVFDDRYARTTDHATMVAAVQSAGLVVGHNVMGFDVPALGVDVIALANERRVLDTMILDSLLDPPDFGMKPEQAARAKYALDAACRRYGVPGKSGDLKSAAKRHGGFGSIPVDDREHLDYLRGDVLATAALFRALVTDPSNVSEYAWREMRIAAIASHMSTVGFAVDRALLDERVDVAEQRQRELIKWLTDTHGIPTTLPNGQPAKAPHATKAGKQALTEAFGSVGVSSEELPRTSPSAQHPDGQVSFSADGLADIADRFPAARELCEAVGALVGVRSVYATAAKHLHVDGRVHPDVTMFQASGRWSVTKPGVTVFGKRGGRVTERDVFVASPGHVLLSADLSQVDARSVAAHSGDPAYAALFAPGVDAHIEVAKLVWGASEIAKDPKHLRDKVKGVTHGTSYGMGIPKLAATAGVSEDEALRVVTTLREEFPGVEEWKREVRERAEAGEWLDNGFGRLMRPNPERAWTQGPALMGQGTARDILMEGLLRMPDDVQRMLRAVVHDEVVIECPAEDAQDVRQVIVESLSFDWCPPDRDVPVSFLAECSEPAERWSGCY